MGVCDWTYPFDIVPDGSFNNYPTINPYPYSQPYVTVTTTTTNSEEKEDEAEMKAKEILDRIGTDDGISYTDYDTSIRIVFDGRNFVLYLHDYEDDSFAAMLLEGEHALKIADYIYEHSDNEGVNNE